MANTYSLLASNVLTGTAASVTFSAIPQNYTDLVLKISQRSDYSASQKNITINFNDDITASYSLTYLQGNGAAGSSGRNSAQTFSDLTNTQTLSTFTANAFGFLELYIPNYTSSTTKPASVMSANETNATTAYVSAFATLFNKTSAITSITIGLFGNFVSGSSFYLYGISKS